MRCLTFVKPIDSRSDVSVTSGRFRMAAVIKRALALVLSAMLFGGRGEQQQTARDRAEEAARANNRGVALLEQFKYDEAVRAFRRALEIEPRLALARVNLSIALYYARNLAEAEREARAAAEQAPHIPQPFYILGLIARAQNQTDAALAAFKRVRELDPDDVTTEVQLGQLYLHERRYADAIAHLKRAVELEPFHVTASYNLALALIRAGRREEGQRLMQRFEELRQSGYGTALGQNYLEQGRYAEALPSTGAEPELVDPHPPDVTFAEELLVRTDARQDIRSPFGERFALRDWNDALRRRLVAALGGGLVFFDYDGDGDRDLFVVAPERERLLRNDGGRFVDVTDSAMFGRRPEGAIGIGAVAADYDNDGRPDLFVLRDGASALYRNQGDGTFRDVTAQAGIPRLAHLALAAAFVDLDHDGDLDLFIAGFADLARPPAGEPDRQVTFPDDFPAAPHLLLRNNGNGTFTDITAAAQLAGPTGHAIAVAPTDYDNRRDVDLLILHAEGRPALFRNMRDGTFRDVAKEVGITLEGRFRALAMGDVNKDGFTDFFFGAEEAGSRLALSDGRGRFALAAAPVEAATAAQFVDYDNDGLLDLVVGSARGMRVFRSLGRAWSDVSERALATTLRDPLRQPASAASWPSGSAIALAVADADRDGDLDLAVRWPTGAISFGRNEGGNRQGWLRVELSGRVSNRGGIGAKIEMRAGSLWQKLEYVATTPAVEPAEILFGLGPRPQADAVRVLWPSGVVQAETESAPAQPAPLRGEMRLTELDRKPSSCPYLFAWNGERFIFITDFLGGGEMGYWVAPGTYNRPDPDEYVRIDQKHLQPRAGLYELRITNELEEVLYLDRVQLVVIEHPADVEVYPNEGLRARPPSFHLFGVKDLRAPLSAVDEHGHDVRSKIAALDRQYPDDFALLPIRGYAEEHALTLEIEPSRRGRTLLLLTGWTDYAFSSDNVAAWQQGQSLRPPILQVEEAPGTWRTAIADVGFPAGRPQTIVLDVTEACASAGTVDHLSRCRLRLLTNMRIYWDRIVVGTEVTFARRLRWLDPVEAVLRCRGFSSPISPDGREPLIYEYERASRELPWKLMPGRYTRYGDVRPLLVQTDSRFVIAAPGDEIALEFDARAALPKGWARTFLLYASGYSKEMDINSASPDVLAPLPFQGMSRYPYRWPEAYPHGRDLRLYHTRPIRRPLPLLLGADRNSAR
jgi:tetratricopeptide (TPR) repeat protein